MVCSMRDKLRSFCATDCIIRPLFAFVWNGNGLALGVSLWALLPIAATPMRANKWLRACLEVENGSKDWALTARKQNNILLFRLLRKQI